MRRAVEEAVKETPEYRCMQSQFSVLYNESLQLKAHLDEARTLLHGTRTTHQRQVELIEVAPLFCQIRECFHLSDHHYWVWVALGIVRKFIFLAIVHLFSGSSFS